MEKEHFKLPRLREMIDLYRTCMGLTRDGEVLLRMTVRLKRLSLNAEIFSVQAGDKGRVFQSLSKETKKLSKDISVAIYQLLEQVESIAGRAMESAEKTRLCEKYREALDLGLSSATEQLVELHRRQVGGGVIEAISSVFASLRASHLTMAEMERLYLQLPAIATLMKIEANREIEFRESFSSNAEDLLMLNEDLSHLIKKVHKKTTDALNRIEKMGDGGVV